MNMQHYALPKSLKISWSKDVLGFQTLKLSEPLVLGVILYGVAIVDFI